MYLFTAALVVSLITLNLLNTPHRNYHDHPLEQAFNDFIKHTSSSSTYAPRRYQNDTFSGHVTVRTEQHAEEYQIFRLAPDCTTVKCARHVISSLQRLKCSHIRHLSSLNLVEARCDGVPQLSAHQVGEFAEKYIVRIDKRYDNMVIPPPSEGESVDRNDPYHRKLLEESEIVTSPSQMMDGEEVLEGVLLDAVGRFVQTERVPWGLDRIDQQKGRDRKLDLSCFPRLGLGIDVYVLDSGCRASHQEFNGRVKLVKVGRYMTAYDYHGHGTHIAGTVAGTTYGVCKRCRIVCVKTLDDTNRGTLMDVMSSINYVVSRQKSMGWKPNVAVLSLGGELNTDLLDNGIEKLLKARVIPVVAAGNGGTDACRWTPSRSDSAITVAASTLYDLARSTSNGGACIDIAAPGEFITSAAHYSDTAVKYMSGTSMAAPHVAGAVALMLAEDPSLTVEEVLHLLKRDSWRVQDVARKTTYGLLRVKPSQCFVYRFGDRPAKSKTFTPSPSRTSIPSRSKTPSPSMSKSHTPFPSISPSATTSRSPKPSKEPSLSPSASRSPSPSMSRSPSPSASRSSSPSMSRSPSPSASHSPTPSKSRTPTPSPSESATLSPSPSKIPSPSPSISGSPSISVSRSPSPSRTPSPSSSPSRSPTPSPSRTPSASPSVTRSSSPSPSKSTSSSPSRSATPSRSMTPSPSLSLSPVRTPSPLPSLLQSAKRNRSKTPPPLLFPSRSPSRSMVSLPPGCPFLIPFESYMFMLSMQQSASATPKRSQLPSSSVVPSQVASVSRSFVPQPSSSAVFSSPYSVPTGPSPSVLMTPFPSKPLLAHSPKHRSSHAPPQSMLASPSTTLRVQDLSTSKSAAPAFVEKAPVYEVGRVQILFRNTSGVACSTVTLKTRLENPNAVSVLLAVETNVKTPGRVTKATMGIANLTRSSFAACIFDISRPLLRRTGSSLTLNWLMIQRNGTWIKTGTVKFRRHLIFLDGQCETVTDNRASSSDDKAVILPGFRKTIFPQNRYMSSFGLVRWIEKFDSRHFSYCIQNVLQSKYSARRVVPFFETYILVLTAHSEGRVYRGFISVPPWHPDLFCKSVELRAQASKPQPYIFASLRHPVTHGNAYSSDSAMVWITNVTKEGFTLCVEEIRWFWEENQSFQSEATVEWIAIYEQ